MGDDRMGYLVTLLAVPSGMVLWLRMDLDAAAQVECESKT
jgi:hypothetical protein